MIRNIEGLRLYYEVLGSGSPMLLLHGWANDSGTLRPLAELLKQDGFTVYSLDLPGFGLSDFPGGAWEVSDYARIVEKFLAEMSLSRVDLLGHSFGGRISIKLAALKPELVRRLVLVDSAGIKPKRSFSYYTRVYFTRAARAAAKLLPERGRAQVNEWLLERFGSRDYRNAGKLRATFTKVVNEDLREYLPKIRAKTLLVWGENDEETPLEDGKLMHSLIPGARLEVIAGTGHHPFLENPTRFAGILRGFLAEKE